MANKEAGERKLVIGDEHLTLKFTTSAYLELEDFLGYSSGELEQKFREQKVGFRELQGLLWAGTRKFHRRDIPSPVEIADIMDGIPEIEGGYATVWETATEAYAIGQGHNPNEEDGDEAPKSRRERRKKQEATKGDQDKPTDKPKAKSSPGEDS